MKKLFILMLIVSISGACYGIENRIHAIVGQSPITTSDIRGFDYVRYDNILKEPEIVKREQLLDFYSEALPVLVNQRQLIEMIPLLGLQPLGKDFAEQVALNNFNISLTKLADRENTSTKFLRNAIISGYVRDFILNNFVTPNVLISDEQIINDLISSGDLAVPKADTNYYFVLSYDNSLDSFVEYNYDANDIDDSLEFLQLEEVKVEVYTEKWLKSTVRNYKKLIEGIDYNKMSEPTLVKGKFYRIIPLKSIVDTFGKDTYNVTRLDLAEKTNSDYFSGFISYFNGLIPVIIIS